MIVHNHPYLGASHSPDVAVAVPIFHDGELLAWAAGDRPRARRRGLVPGDQRRRVRRLCGGEALQRAALVPTRRAQRRRRPDDLRQRPHRDDEPRRHERDARRVPARARAVPAARAALRRPDGDERRVRLDGLLERRLRAEIEKIPDGEYGPIVGWLDDDARNRDVRLRVETKVVVSGDEITIDLTGSNPRCRPASTSPSRARCWSGPTTPCARSCSTRSRSRPRAAERRRLPAREGGRTKGTIFNPTFPRACFSRFTQVQRVVDNTILALADALPDKVTAGTPPASTSARTPASTSRRASTGSTSR